MSGTLHRSARYALQNSGVTVPHMVRSPMRHPSAPDKIGIQESIHYGAVSPDDLEGRGWRLLRELAGDDWKDRSLV